MMFNTSCRGFTENCLQSRQIKLCIHYLLLFGLVMFSWIKVRRTVAAAAPLTAMEPVSAHRHIKAPPCEILFCTTAFSAFSLDAYYTFELSVNDVQMNASHISSLVSLRARLCICLHLSYSLLCFASMNNWQICSVVKNFPIRYRFLKQHQLQTARCQVQSEFCAQLSVSQFEWNILFCTPFQQSQNKWPSLSCFFAGVHVHCPSFYLNTR